MQSNIDDHTSTTVARNLKLSIKPAKCEGNFFVSKRFNPFMLEVAIFNFLHEIRVCYLEKFKKQEFEEKKILLYFIVELCGVPKMEH
jgi:hypothetical protein